ncbi:MAG TPA: hypothetical protein VLT58_09135, partial [Polyangia bacterium]|nr:hypothetical protein [Polyangia bacterium]
MHCGDGFRCDTSINRCVENTGGSTGGAGGIGGMAGIGGIGGAAGAAGIGGSPDGGVDKPPPRCDSDGAAVCSSDKPICDRGSGKCRTCGDQPDDCMTLNPALPVCRPAGDGGRPAACVECTQDSHCADRTKPVCDQSHNVCVGCATDDDCQRFTPSVCKTAAPSSADAGAAKGHCVGNGETIYVSKTAACSDTPTSTTAEAGADAGVRGESTGRPFCSMEPIRTILSATRNVVVVSGEVSGASWSYNNQAGGPLLIVGQGATIAGAASPA